MTVAALAALRAGDKASFGRSIYGRRNKDDSVTVTLRRKVAGKSVDVPVIRLDTINKATISAALREAERVREKAPAPAQEARTAGARKAGVAKTSLAMAWEDFVGKVTWSDVNRAGNVLRVAKYLETWDLWIAPVSDITARDVAKLLGPIRSNTPSQYRKVVGLLNQSFTQAVGLEWIETTPMLLAQKLLANTSGKVAKAKHHPALLDWDALRELVKAIRNATGEPSVRNALYLQCLTAQRTGEVLGARWEEFDLAADVPTWTIPRSRMKITDSVRGDHVIHLSKQCAEWLRGLPRGKGTFLFPGRMGADTIKSEAMSKHMRNTLGMRDQHVPHSWRSSLRTLSSRAVDADGRPLFNSEWTESILDHLSGDAVTDAYQRGQHAVEGGRVLQWWCDQLLLRGEGG